MSHINIYCDESNHLERDPKPMVLGAISCSSEKAKEVNSRIKEIKEKHGLSRHYEIKWTKVNKVKIDFFKDIIDYFFDIRDLDFRAVIAKKDNLDHAMHNHTHDDWYYKIYYLLLTKIINSNLEYKICLDRKDTLGKERVDQLRKVLCRTKYDFNTKIIKEIREVHSNTVQLVQVVDLLIGAIQFNLCSKDNLNESVAKREIVKLVQKRSGRSLERSTLPSEIKFNLFFWDGKKK